MTARGVGSTLTSTQAQIMMDCCRTNDPAAQLAMTVKCTQMHARMGLLEGYLPIAGKGLPWVPASGTAFLDGTAAADIDDAVMGRAWSSWEVALVSATPGTLVPCLLSWIKAQPWLRNRIE